MRVPNEKLLEIQKRGELARQIVSELNPEATFRVYNNKNGNPSIEGLSVNDCCDICAELDTEFTAAGDIESARLVHEIPVLVFATLRKDQIPDFLIRWKEVTP